jgi:hypothetical protein
MGAWTVPGILRRAQDDGKNKQRQVQKSKDKISSSKKQKQIPFGDDNQETTAKPTTAKN